MNIREKYPILPAEGGQRKPFENEPEYFVLNSTCPREKLFKHIKKKNPERSQERKSKHLTFRGTNIRIAFDFSETIQTRQRNTIFKMWRGKKRMKNINPEFCTLKNYPSKVKRK